MEVLGESMRTEVTLGPSRRQQSQILNLVNLELDPGSRWAQKARAPVPEKDLLVRTELTN